MSERDCKSAEETLFCFHSLLSDYLKSREGLFSSLFSQKSEQQFLIRDFHASRLFSSSSFYTLLSHFTPDWLNDYSVQTLTEDFGFVDCGQRGSWNGLHRDVDESYKLVSKDCWEKVMDYIATTP